jgi:DNA replication licensing factor MCM3
MQSLDNGEKDENTTPVYQKYDKLLHGNRKKQEIFSIPFIKKYLLYAKFRVAPKLSEEANTLIANSYAQLRSKEDMKVKN